MEKRRDQRHRTSKGPNRVQQWQLDFGLVGPGMSNTVAQLRFENAFHVPDDFDLMFAGKSAAHPGRVIWRKQNRGGVQFVP
jgi:hypothetical protein